MFTVLSHASFKLYAHWTSFCPELTLASYARSIIMSSEALKTYQSLVSCDRQQWLRGCSHRSPSYWDHSYKIVWLRMKSKIQSINQSYVYSSTMFDFSRNKGINKTTIKTTTTRSTEITDTKLSDWDWDQNILRSINQSVVCLLFIPSTILDFSRNKGVNKMTIITTRCPNWTLSIILRSQIQICDKHCFCLSRWDWDQNILRE